MSRKTSVNLNDDFVQPIYANWLTITVDLISPKDLYLIAGRATAKTSEIIAKRSMNVIYDMPRSMQVSVSDTYVNAMKNVVPALLEGWNREGWKEGVHYVTDTRPPASFELPYRPFKGSYKHTISVFNGTLINIGSLDQPGGLAGNSYQHMYGDEARILKQQKLKKLTPAIRGEYAHFGHSVYYRGRTFTTDMPNLLDGDDEWIFSHEKDMNVDQAKLALQVALVLNDIKKELINAMKDRDKIKVQQLKKNLHKWTAYWIRCRKGLTFFYVVSSLVNVDILSEGFFEDSLKALGIEEFKSAILSLKVDVKKGEKFYPYLGEHHYYDDGINSSYYDKFKLTDEIEESSLALKYIDHNAELDAGVDFGDICSMVTAQERGSYLYCLKEFFTLAPESSKELAAKFVSFYKHHKNKVLNLYYDRSGNQYQKVKRDWANELKKFIEEQNGVKTGWKVNLMSRNQATIYQEEEYNFCKHLFGETVKGVPKVKIDKFGCKCLRSSLGLTKILVKSDKKGSRSIHKDKASEKISLKMRAMYSTNFSDAFKYLIFRKRWVSKTTSKGSLNMSAPEVL
ncbi:hypothetical protein SAMN05216480_10535 [Pustulibacterium marinum]|uniref:Uncharacterized protein n=1 Tax=Pustulibacterium marinum TaxID=1224947 RepID=A0A1I7GKQ0_9FLAO|nr:hypothetical protein [Pustulibacterium marinum]SFU49008.1 hypothetical protein SAMN05216480_10535 [Pustulibacterium marinum]